MQFEQDLAQAGSELEAARSELLAIVQSLTDTDLDKTRRGAWSVRSTLAHVIQSEWWYARGVATLRELDPQPPVDPGPLVAVRDVSLALQAARAALTDACDGVDEEHFYVLRKIGPQDYSVLSILENCADHDREHARQVAELAGKS